jgi:hypothetical protein
MAKRSLITFFLVFTKGKCSRGLGCNLFLIA